jgi:hypothetical protein
MSSKPPAIQYSGPPIHPDVPQSVRHHLQLIYQKLGNHTQAFDLLNQKATQAVTVIAAGGGGGGKTSGVQSVSGLPPIQITGTPTNPVVGILGSSNSLDAKDSCRLATAAALPAYTYAANIITANANGALTVDGVSPIVGDRILLKDGAAGTDNGIYSVTQVGDASNPFILTRTTDCLDSSTYLSGSFTCIQEGMANALTLWLVTTQGTIVVDTTAVTWTELSAAALPPLTDAHLFVGNVSNVATDVPASGDVSLLDTGAFTVVGLETVPLDAATVGSPSNGDVITYDSGLMKYKAAAGGGSGVTAVTGVSPIASTLGTTPAISLQNSAGIDVTAAFGTGTAYFTGSGGPTVLGDIIVGDSLGGIQDSGISLSGIIQSSSLIVHQVAHSLSVQDAIYYDGSNWLLAKADNADTLGIGIVSSIIGPDDFVVTFSGLITGLSGLISGNYYFVSDSTSGLLDITEPINPTSYSNPLLFSLSGTDGIVLQARPSSIGSAGLVFSGDLIGTFSSQTVVGLENVPLDAATIGSPVNGQVITYVSSSGKYEAQTPATGSFTAGGDLSGSTTNQIVIGLETVPLDATTVGSPSNGWVITYDSASGKYKAVAPASGAFTAGGDLSGTTTSQVVIGLESIPLDSVTVGTPSDGWVITYNAASGKYEAILPATSATFVDNEVVSISSTTGTLTNAPNPSTSLHLYRNGVRQQSGIGNDYTLSSATITLAVAKVSGDIFLADYRY